MRQKTALLVLGMHRSGTSAFTRLLSTLGAQLPSDLLAPTPANARGFWESTRLMETHDALLRSAGVTWDAIGGIDQSWYASPAAEHFKRELAQFLVAEFDDASLFAIKDPRMCRFAALWIEALREFGAAPKVVVPIRDPLEVAASLRARDGLGPIGSTFLWLCHVLDAERDTRCVPRTFAGYDELLADWRRVAHKIGDDLDLQWPHPVSRTAETETDEFFSREYKPRCADADALENHPRLAEWTKTTYAALLALRCDPKDPCALSTLDGIAAQFETTMLASAELNAEYRAEVARVKGDLHAREERIDNLSECLAGILASRSWRLTKPLRAVARLLRGGVGLDRGGPK